MSSIKVNWYDEVGTKRGDNNGYLYGIYVQDDEGDVIDATWYQTEEQRDAAFEDEAAINCS